MKRLIIRLLALARAKDPLKHAVLTIIKYVFIISILLIIFDFIQIMTGKIEGFSFYQAVLYFVSSIFLDMDNNSRTFELGYLVALLLVGLISMLIVSMPLWYNQKRQILKLVRESQANHTNFMKIKDRCSNQSKCFKDIG